MKTKIIISLVIFIHIILYFNGLTVGISDPVALSDMPWDYPRIIITTYLVVAAAMFASVPYWKLIYQKVFLYNR